MSLSSCKACFFLESNTVLDRHKTDPNSVSQQSKIPPEQSSSYNMKEDILRAV
jgi:hypothetical protein